MADSTKGHSQRACHRLRIGFLKRPLSELGDGSTSSSYSLIPMEFFMVLTVISFTREARQLSVVTAGSDLPHWLGQVDGPSSNSSSSIKTEFYTE